jgi:bacterial/archaeal transporter family protein
VNIVASSPVNINTVDEVAFCVHGVPLVRDWLYLACMQWFFWALLSALFAGLTAVFAKVGVTSINSNLATAIRTSIILVITWGIALASSRIEELVHVPKRSWVFLVLSAAATGLSWLCYFRALQLGEVSQVAPIDKLSVVIAIVISVLFLGERLGLREGIGAGLIVTGTVFLAWK